MDTYKKLITELDAKLTGKPMEVCEKTFKDSGANTIEDLVWGRLYYLSDGGYSRLFFYDESCTRLTASSREEVKEAWKYCQEEVKALDKFILETLHNL